MTDLALHNRSGYSRGFTLVELVAVMIIIGILSAVAIPRFFDAQKFNDLGFYTEVINAVRYAQQYAVASNCDVQVTLNGNDYSVQRRAAANCTGGFNTPLQNPAILGAPLAGSLAGAGMPDLAFSFNALGVPFDNMGVPLVTTNINVSGNSFRINGVTGYIQEL